MGNAEDSQEKKEESSFLCVMSTSYRMVSESYGGDMVDFNGGYVTRGTMKTGDRAMLVKSDGSNYEAVIEKVALYREEDKGNPTPVNEAGEGPLVFVWLAENPSEELREQASWKRADKVQYGDMLLGMKEWEQGTFYRAGNQYGSGSGSHRRDRERTDQRRLWNAGGWHNVRKDTQFYFAERYGRIKDLE